METQGRENSQNNPTRSSAIPTVVSGFLLVFPQITVVRAGQMDSRGNPKILPQTPGYYSGLLCSGYMMGRFLSSHFWGMVSDCHGRLFVVVIGLVSTTVTSVAFGVSTTFAWAFAFR